jgi:perosamine synthetase
LTNIQAALGLAQMECLDKFIRRKRRIAEIYHKQLRDVPGIILPQEASWAFSTWWLYTIEIEEKFELTSRQMVKLLQAQGIQTRPLWHPLPALAPFKDCYAYKVEVAPVLWARALSLPSSSSLAIKDQERVISAICRMPV